MDDYKVRLIQQLDEAIKVVDESGEDSYIRSGLSIAKDIVNAGPDADATELVNKILDGCWN